MENKDSAILEFLPANQAYNWTPVKGFRTFLKVKKKARTIFYEPFREGNAGLYGRISTKMVINSARLEIEEINPSLGVKINISYITVPNESFAGLARKVSITNISKSRIELEVLDGLPQVTPFGMTEWHQKHMSRTIEAWMRVRNLKNNAPFYNLKVCPQDRPEIEYVKRGNFYAACGITGNRVSELKPLIDPDMIFGKDGDLSYPAVFAGNKSFAMPKSQKNEGKTPSAFAYAKFGLAKDQSAKIVSITGNVENVNDANAVLRKMKQDAAYFERKLAESEDIIKRLENHIFTKSSSDEFDFYSRQTYLDNLLRGGFPVSIATKKGPFVFYAYARKHGDLERDYNAFLLQPSYYSQGNGAYRDINQNRRNDTFFNPRVGDENIMTFMNAIQPDGFNPHLIEGISISVKNLKALDSILKRHIKHAPHRNRARAFLRDDFTPGSFISFFENEGIMAKAKADRLLKDILPIGKKEDSLRPGEGYWIDHWTYNIDLFENYLACYPERLKKLLLDKKDLTFYDTYLRVVPRDEKYVYAGGKIRQYGAVVVDEEKKRAIEKRPGQAYKVRTGFGRGKAYRTNLLVKLICVIANKMASLDSFGIGIEMEAGKPGWCDSLNGMPGIFGSSLCEVFELKRLILFIKSALSQLKVKDGYKIGLPSEISGFLLGLERLVGKNLLSKSGKSDFDYWDASWKSKERYRAGVWPGFSGKEKYISSGKLREVLDKFLLKLERGIRKGFSKKDGMTFSYYINAVTKYRFIYANGRKKVNCDGLPVIRALSFNHRPLSLFLEGPMHAMRVMSRKEAALLYKAIRKSRIFDKKLKMYKVNEPLEGMPAEIGRSTVFTPGWLENESVWLHMEYKYLLELLKKGLYKEFFSDLRNCLVAFQDPKRYGRSVLENSSFIAASAYPDASIHGNGFVARLTGTTTEFITMWLLMCLGRRPFGLDNKGKLYFEPRPAIPGSLFTRKESVSHFYFAGGMKKVKLPKNTFSSCFLGKTLLVYYNPAGRDTFGRRAVEPKEITLTKHGKPPIRFTGGRIPAPYADRMREGSYDRIDVRLS